MDSTEGAFTDRIKDVEGISKEELGNKFEQNSYDQYFTEDTGIGSHTAKSPEELISSRKERLSAGRMFKLENLESHLFMEAVGNEMYTAPFAAAIVEDSGSDSYYKRAYTFNATENGWFQIIPLSNIGLAAELSQSGASGEYEIFFCPAREGDMSQGWRLVFVEEGGYYNIQSVMEESLFLAESASEKGSRLTVRPGADEDPAQRWQLWPLIGVSVKDPEWLRLIYGEESTLYEENTEIPETEASENPE
ncbi:MAG: hypothetical protein IKN57_01410 [Parasporobacterium sp.]|nr:hypothetical protein [Parasporobacterium sp.]